jgi:hypothetical protein
MQFSYQTLCCEFACSLLDMIHKDKYLEWVLISTEAATCHMSGHVNHHNVQIWGTENLHVACQHIFNGSKRNV